VKTRHVETHEIISTSKSGLPIPEAVTVHRRESTHLHPNMATAFIKVGHEGSAPLKSGIGKDPRRAFEEAHWTEEEKEGHRAYVKSVWNAPKVEECEQNPNNMANFWTKEQRMESPKSAPLERSERRPSSASDQIKVLQETTSRPLQEGRAASENVSLHSSLEDQINRLSRLSNKAPMTPEVKDTDPKTSGTDPEVIVPSPKLTYPTKDRVRPPAKNRLSGVRK
jgi:hypothetical protein